LRYRERFTLELKSEEGNLVPLDKVGRREGPEFGEGSMTSLPHQGVYWLGTGIQKLITGLSSHCIIS